MMKPFATMSQVRQQVGREGSLRVLQLVVCRKNLKNSTGSTPGLPTGDERTSLTTGSRAGNVCFRFEEK